MDSRAARWRGGVCKERLPPERSIVVVAAWEPELERFRDLAKDESGLRLSIEPVGIGPVDAAVGTTCSILRHAAENVVLLGTCGAFPESGLVAGDVVVGTEVAFVEPAVVEERAAMPYAASALALDGAMLAYARSEGARPVAIANTAAITIDDALASRLASQGQVEHLEAYGVAQACARASIGCTVILGVANAVGARGREEWRANHVMASARAAEIAWRVLDATKTSTTRQSPG